MPDEAYVARHTCACNSQDSDNWKSVGGLAERLVMDAARKIGGAA